jgi:hypothetical protein
VDRATGGLTVSGYLTRERNTYIRAYNSDSTQGGRQNRHLPFHSSSSYSWLSDACDFTAGEIIVN